MISQRIGLRVLLSVVLLGLVLRAYHYLRDPVMWHDEAAAVINILDKSWPDLLGPLYWAEAAPPLFLWASRAAALTLGDSTLALRLVPFLASCALVLLVARVAWRQLDPVPAIVATLLVAVSDRLLWHTCEAKPYAIDALLAIGLIALHLVGKNWRLEWLLLLQILLAPLIIWISYPGAFLLGASLLALLPRVWAERRWSGFVLYGLWSLAVGVAFLALVVGPARAQRCGPMDACWTGHFPPYANPIRVPLWVLASTLEVGRYCFQPLGTGLILLAGVGGVVWVRAGRGALVVLCAVPLGLALVASFLRQYPFGASRLEVFAAPGLALLIGAGLVPLWTMLARWHRWAPGVVVVLLASCVFQTAYRAAVPWYREDAAGAARYVLARIQSDDRVFGNKWEHLYYFRSRDEFQLMGASEANAHPQEAGKPIEQHSLPGRCWILFASSARGPRPRPVSEDWWERHQLIEHRTFTGTDVYLLGP